MTRPLRTVLPPDALDSTDRAILNALQDGFPLTQQPYDDAGTALGITGADLIARLARMRDLGTAGAGVVEIGEPDGVPGWIAYPVPQGWQLDEFDGDSRRYPDLAVALEAVADV